MDAIAGNGAANAGAGAGDEGAGGGGLTRCSGAAGRLESLSFGIPSFARRSAPGCTRGGAGDATGELGGGSDAEGRVQACAAPGATGALGSPPTTIIGERSAGAAMGTGAGAAAGAGAASAPTAGMRAIDGFGGGASLRNAEADSVASNAGADSSGGRSPSGCDALAEGSTGGMP